MSHVHFQPAPRATPRARSFIGARLILVVSSAIVMMAVAAFVGVNRGDVERDIASGIVESPQARTEVAESVASDVREVAPILASLPALDVVVSEAMNTPFVEPELHGWFETAIATRLDDGQRETAVQLAMGGAVMAAIAAASSYAFVRSHVGRSSAAMLLGLGGLTAAGALVGLREAAGLDSELTSLAANSIISMQIVCTVTGVSLLFFMRGLLADTGLLAYGVRSPLGHVDESGC